MARTGFLNQLSRLSRVTVDTNCCIYHIEAGASEGLRALAAQLFELGARRSLEIDLPGIVRFEMMVLPLRRHDQLAIVKARRFFAQRGVTASPVSEDVLLTAAEIRARTNLKAPDALVAASAMVHGSEAIVGNDRDFGKVARAREEWPALPRYILMEDYVEGPKRD